MKIMPRMFNYNNIVLDDPDPQMSPEDVKNFYANLYPELTQAIVEGPELGENLEYKFNRSYGTKGTVTVKDLLTTKTGTKQPHDGTDYDYAVRFGEAVHYEAQRNERTIPLPSEALSPII